jgi:hypothetical protein
MLTDFVEVDVTGDELREGVDDADDWFAELLFFDAISSPETAGTSHSSSLGRSRAAQWNWHDSTPEF